MKLTRIQKILLILVALISASLIKWRVNFRFLNSPQILEKQKALFYHRRSGERLKWSDFFTQFPCLATIPRTFTGFYTYC